MSDDNSMRLEMIKEFLIEAQDELGSVVHGLTEIEKDDHDPEELGKIYRSIHTIKGAASFLQFSTLESVAHSVENVFDLMRENSIEITPGLIDVLLSGVDLISAILTNVESNGEEGTHEHQAYVTRLEKYVETGVDSEASQAADPVPTESSEQETTVEPVLESESVTDSVVEVATAEEKAAEPEEVVDLQLVAEEEPVETLSETTESEVATGELSAAINNQDEVKMVKEPEVVEEAVAEQDPEAIAKMLMEENERMLSGELDVSKIEIPAAEPVAVGQSTSVVSAPAVEEPPKVELSVVKEEEQKAQVEVAPSVTENSELTPKKEEPVAKAKVEKPVTDMAVRVNVNLLDKMMNVVGELVLNRNQLLQYANSQEASELTRLVGELNTITTELQSDIMTTRMQPIGSIINKFERVIRDLGRSTGKKVNLLIEGKDTELDRTVLEAIRDPMTHLVRNSVDHGIESPEERLAAGKSDTGQVTIKAYHEGGQVTIEIRDDGKGLSREKVIKKALEKGLITEEEAANMPSDQVAHLIFLPGFSTAEKVTNISGRGVGMDVVKTNVEKIGGQVDVTSEPGKGSVFKLKIPLTLAIVPAMIAREGEQFFSIPQVNLVELVRLDEDRSHEIESLNGAEFFRLRGKLIPILRLRDVIRQDDGREKSEDKGLNIVVLNAEGYVYGLVVDGIQDTQEIVIKPLGKQFQDLTLYAGATIMGDGRVSLILDVVGFAKRAQISFKKGQKETGNDSGVKAVEEEKQETLVFRINSDSLYCMPLQMVNRLEEFSTEDVEHVGDKPVIRYRDNVMPLIDVGEHLGMESTKLEGEPKPVVVVYTKGRYFGMVVEEIMDISLTDSGFKTNLIAQPGIMGSVFISDRTVSVIDVFYFIHKEMGVKDSFEEDEVEALGAISKEKRILVAEDSPFFNKQIVNIIKQCGFLVDSVFDGQAALEKLIKGDYSLLISDIEMPIMDGFELSAAMQEDDRLKDLPRIAVTTRFEPEDQERGRAVGYTKYLEKLRKDEIVANVSSLLKEAN